MRGSSSIELVWQLAARETIAAEFAEIEPEHLFSAVLKFAELPINDLENLGAGAATVRLLITDVGSVREALEEREIDSRLARRRVRRSLGKGVSQFTGGIIHRSRLSREVFSSAENQAILAGSETLLAIHLLHALLASPSDKMVEAIGRAVRPVASDRGKTPLLDALGRDLAGHPKEGAQVVVANRRAEYKALIQVLGQEPRKCVFLISESDDAARQVVTAVAKAVIEKTTPRSMRGIRIIDISSLMPDTLQITRLFAEAAIDGRVILFGPPVVTDPPGADEGVWSFIDALKQVDVQCICRVAPEAYKCLVKRDGTWRKVAEVLYLSDGQMTELPSEL